MAVYYNEIDPFAAQWLRNLIAAGHIAAGDVDTRSILDVSPADLAGYTQHHFFAGIGVWSYALRRAGWADDRPVWTGSCPCQPFSAAGKGGGFDDERHLWPAFFHLISQCHPGDVLGEQVASKDGLAWLDLVQADLEGAGYASGAVDFCSAGVGAPHIRQRLYWTGKRLANAEDVGRRERSGNVSGAAGPNQGALARQGNGHAVGADSATSGLADVSGSGRREERQDAGGLAVGNRAQGLTPGLVASSSHSRPGPTNGFWGDADWLHCRDRKWRPVEPGAFPLAHGTASRVGRLRGYGNAINAEAATAFIAAHLETPEPARLNKVDLLS